MSIPGYRHGDTSLPPSPVTLEELERMKATCLFTDADAAALREAHALVEGRTEEILDIWYGFVASQPHLVASFAKDGEPPQAHYLAAVRRRFAQWILDTTAAQYDQAWLDYQAEIGRRHHRIGKGRADSVHASAHIRFLDLLPLAYPIFATMRPFFVGEGVSPERTDAMHHAWLKSLLMQLTLWTRPYVRDGDY